MGPFSIKIDSSGHLLLFADPILAQFYFVIVRVPIALDDSYRCLGGSRTLESSVACLFLVLEPQLPVAVFECVTTHAFSASPTHFV